MMPADFLYSMVFSVGDVPLVTCRTLKCVRRAKFRAVGALGVLDAVVAAVTHDGDEARESSATLRDATAHVQNVVRRPELRTIPSDFTSLSASVTLGDVARAVGRALGWRRR